MPSIEVIDAWLAPYPEDVRDACMRIVKDPASRDMWGTAFDNTDFRQFMHALDQALHRETWDKMPQRERQDWIDDFQKTTDRLLTLMENAPTPPKQWGMPVRERVLMELLRRCGLSVPPYDSQDYWRDMMEKEAIADSFDFTIADALRWYALQQRANWGPTQILKKPRDAKADRAHFIVCLSHYTYCTDATIAAVAAAAFEDPAIDAKLVHRLCREK